MYKALLKQLESREIGGLDVRPGETCREAAKAIRDLLKHAEPRYFALVMESKMISAGHSMIHQIKAFKTLSQIKSFLGGLRDRDYISLKVDEYGLTEI